MKKILQGALAAMLVASASSAYAQNPTFEWVGNVADGNYVPSVTADMDGNSYWLGYFSGTMDADPTAGVFNLTTQASGGGYYLVKSAPDGSFIWAKKSDAPAMGKIIYANGNLYVVGSVYAAVGTRNVSFSADSTINVTPAGTDIFCMKMDTSATPIWVKTLGSTGADIPLDLAVQPDGKVIIAGSFEGTIDLDPNAGTQSITTTGSTAECFMVRLDADGNYDWSQHYPVAYGPYGFIDEVVSDGVVAYMALNVYTHHDTITLGGTQISAPAGAGQYTYKPVVVKFDPNSGAPIWVRQFSAAEVESQVYLAIAGSNRDVAVSFMATAAGQTINYNPTGTTNISHVADYEPVLLKFSSAGALLAAHASRSSNYAAPFGLTADYMGNIYNGIQFYDTIRVDVANSAYDFVQNTGAYIMKYTASNTIDWVMASDSGAVYGGALTLDNRGNIYTAFRGTGCTTNFIDNSGVVDANELFFLAKYSQSTFVNVAENQAVASMRLYPNPAASLLNIENAPVGEQLRVVDALGRVVISQTINQANFQLATEALPNGMYLLQAGRQNAQKVLISK